SMEQEGSYNLPEAQQDRFMLSISMNYLTQEEEVTVVRQSTGAVKTELKKVIGGEDLVRFAAAVRSVKLPPELGTYIVDLVASSRKRILAEIRKAIVGQEDVVNDVVTSFFAGGHCLITGVPGLAKTLLISSISKALDLKFSRVQFTPDLMPSDITGTEVLEEDHASGRRFFKFVHGPVFGNVVLADEINRAPPKTQAALLQAMQEHAVTAAGKTHRLPEPF